MEEELALKFSTDGDQWMCFLEGFTNLEESLAGFGCSRKEAAEDLFSKLGDDLT